MENYDGYGGCLRRRMRASRDTAAGYVEISIFKHTVLKINFYVPSRKPVGEITVFRMGYDIMFVHIIVKYISRYIILYVIAKSQFVLFLKTDYYDYTHGI